ncbi:Polyribonucleotide nucleotidyltransferase [Parasponia andersonii]|uniref:Polyribonucleotide nucleotidyltransferase n=1 Tax=Parasponia andersonii TaxID=3476 RepID=A0A2P5BWL3_PARAD|nr:Polyribonucleotide nucleotidyltransferase [Parasponia andersonii]
MEPSFKTPTPETLFRLLCPASKTGALIGKCGSVIRHIRDLTGARIRIDDSVSSSDERVILISSADSPLPWPKHDHHPDHKRSNSSSPNVPGGGGSSDGEGSPAQLALVKVFEKMVMADEERWEESEKESDGSGFAACRLLAASSQVGCVLGRGGKIVEKIRQESGAQVRVLPKDQIPACAAPGDELIQITGSISAVKKALLSVSGCLQDKPRVDIANYGTSKISGRMLHGSGPENIGTGHRMVIEEEIVFKLLCQVDKVGSLIGKGGSVIRHLQNETGAYIKIADAPPDSDERVVLISARENSEQKHSPAQEAVIRVHSRIAEIGFEPGAAVVARLLVHSQQIGCLLGKGGFIISEMRRATGASIRIFTKDQVPKCASHNEEVVQVIGSFQCVQDALFHITSRLRETIIPMKPPHPNFDAPPYLSPYPEMPPPMFRPRHNPASPGPCPSPVGPPHGIDRTVVPSQSLDHQHAYLHGMDHNIPSQMDRVPYPYGSERPGQGRTFDRPSSPRRWNGQGVSCGNPRGLDNSPSFPSRKGSLGSESQAPHSVTATVEIMIPQKLLTHVYGENNSNLTQIRQISGAHVVVNDIKPGASEGLVIVSGTPGQMSSAQCLIHAFILCGQTPG